MMPVSHRNHGHRSRAAPFVQIRAAEVQLAPATRLLCRDCPLSSQPAQAVSADPEILGGTSRVEPLVPARLSTRHEARSDSFRNNVRQLDQQLIKDRVAIADRSAS
jgi:hypothetical protein